MSRNLLTNHGESFRLTRKGKDAPGAGPATCKRADWGLGLSLLGLLIVPLVASIAGVVLGALALADIQKDPVLTGKGRATWAIGLGLLGTLWWLGVLIPRVT